MVLLFSSEASAGSYRFAASLLFPNDYLSVFSSVTSLFFRFDCIDPVGLAVYSDSDFLDLCASRDLLML